MRKTRTCLSGAKLVEAYIKAENALDHPWAPVTHGPTLLRRRCRHTNKNSRFTIPCRSKLRANQMGQAGVTLVGFAASEGGTKSKLHGVLVFRWGIDLLSLNSRIRSPWTAFNPRCTLATMPSLVNGIPCSPFPGRSAPLQRRDVCAD